MKRKAIFNFQFSIFNCLLLFASCADPGGGDALPDGKYPVTFTAAVDGLAVSRATTADGTWTAGDAVAVRVGNVVKRYAPTSINGNSATLAGTDAANTFYWQNTTETKTITAWYPHSANRPTTFTVQTDQSGDGYPASDCMFAGSIAATFRDHALAFKHLPAKVVVHLTNGEGVTEEEMKGATVTILNQATTSGEITTDTDGSATAAQATDGTSEILTNVITSPTGYGKSVQALLVPRQMQGKKFIRVHAGGYDYDHTPADGEADLASGKQYTYTITVKKTGLEVTAGTPGSWTDSSLADGTVTEATFRVHLNDFIAPEHTSDYKVTDANNQKLTASDGVYSTTSNAINISLSASDGYLLVEYFTKVLSGICKQKISYAADTRTYTCTFYDIRSDLKLQDFSTKVIAASSLVEPKVGDYYYSDGSWSTDKSDDKTCIGIVFKVGCGKNDDLNNYSHFMIGGNIHGYVVASRDARDAKCAWGGDGVLIGTPTDQDDYLGYSNSQKIIAKAREGGRLKPDDAVQDYPAMYYITGYEKTVPAPTASSGWYFPSAGQLKDIYHANIQDKLQTVGSAFQSDNYLSSSEYDRGYPSFNVGYVSFKDGTNGFREKDTNPCYVRAILTF